MLLSLNIENIALISKLYVEFNNGLNIITGETGAGKSIMIGSIQFVLGGKATKEIIKKGCDKAQVEAAFMINDHQSKCISELGFDFDDDIIALSRDITSNGKSICRVNGRITTLTSLKQIAAILLEIHGQHETQGLSDKATHLAFLDRFCGDSIIEQLNSVIEISKQYMDLKHKIDQMNMDPKLILQRIDYLTMQLDEYKTLNWQVGEEEELLSLSSKLTASESIRDAFTSSYDDIYNGSKGSSALEILQGALDKIQEIKDLDTEYDEIYNRISECYFNLEDVAITLRQLKNAVESDPFELDKISQRLYDFKIFKKKYGADEADVLDYFKQVEAELTQLQDNIDNADEYSKKLEKIKSAYFKDCERLTTARKQGAKDLEKQMLTQVADLGMKNGNFKVDFIKKNIVSANGIDDVEFLFTANSGEDLKPIVKTASGGEMSRLMLAFKNIDLDNSEIDSMIFDEIDTGISGKMAQAVATKIANISKNNQIICVTHLPQVACMADHHLFVEKTQTDNSTTVKIAPLDYDGRVNEIARLISGNEITDTGILHSKQLLENAKKIK